MTRSGGGSRLRLPALLSVAVLVLGVRAWAPDPGMRRASLWLVALGLGYGHQLGALCFARRGRRAALERVLIGSTALTAGLAFAIALASDAGMWLVLVLALLAAWHVLENDLALGRAAPGTTRLPPLPRALAPHVVAIGAAVLAVGAAWLAPRAAPSLVAGGLPIWLAVWTPEEVIAVLLLYHSAIWLGRGLAVPASTGRCSPRRLAILLVHALPLFAFLAVRDLVPAAYALVASPPIYLFLSAAHAGYTCLERGLEPV